MTTEQNNYAFLEADKIVETALVLSKRVIERFPDSSLSAVCKSIHETAAGAHLAIQHLQKPFWPLRLLTKLIQFFSAILLVYVFTGGINWSQFVLPSSYKELIGLFEPTLGSIVFLIAYFFFVEKLEFHWKQSKILAELNRLRNLAHVIDMHQLTKDPEALSSVMPDTASSPERNLTPAELGRYLDYCSEMLALLSKTAALWAQGFPNPVVVTAVDQIEILTIGLSRKIWQKLSLLGAARLNHK